MEEKTVDLSLTTLMKECSINPNLVLEHQSYFRLKNRKNVHEVFRYKKFNDDFVDTVSCYRKEGELIGIIRPSYDEFLRKSKPTKFPLIIGKLFVTRSGDKPQKQRH